MTDLEHRLRTAMHTAVDAEEASPGQLIRQVRRRHRRHTALVVTAALAAILAVPAAMTAYSAIVRSSPPPVTHKITPKPHSLPSQLSGLPMPAGTHFRFLDTSQYEWDLTGVGESGIIQGLPDSINADDGPGLTRVDGGWVAWPAVSPTCPAPDCAGPPKEFYFFPEPSVWLTWATPVGTGYRVASASHPGAVWLMTYPRPSDDIAGTSASAQLISTAGRPLSRRYLLPAGYLIDRGVTQYLLLSRQDGASVLWNPRTGQTIRQFADVIGAGPSQIVWTQGCGGCQLQVLNLTTGDTVTTRIAGSQLATPRPVLSDDGTLMAVRLAGGPVAVLDTGNGELTVIPGTALSSAAWLRMGWLGESHRLVIIAGLQANPNIAEFGYWQPGDTRLTVAPPGSPSFTDNQFTLPDSTELQYDLP
jgi:hypothetical protein